MTLARWVGLLWCCLAAIPAWAQVPGIPDLVPTAEPAPGPRETPLQGLDADTAMLATVREKLAGDGTIRRVTDELPSLRAQVEEETDQSRLALTTPASWTTNDPLITRWERLRSALGAHQRAIERRTTAISEALATLAELRSKWTKARAEMVPALRPRVDELLTEIEPLEADGAAQLTQLEDLRTHVDTLARAASTQSDALERAEEQARRQLLTQDSPPLWQLARSGFELGALTPAETQRRRSDVRGYLSATRGTLVLQVLMWLAIALGLMRVRSMFDDRPEGQIGRAVGAVLQHPASSSLLVVLLVSLVVHDGAPPLILAVLAVMAAFPLMRLLPLMVAEDVGRWLSPVALLYVMARMAQLLPPGSLQQRGLFLVIALIGASLAIPIARHLLAGHSPLVIQVLGHGSAVALALSALTNIVGLGSFSLILLRGVSGVAFFSLCLWTGILVLQALVLLALRNKPLAQLGMVKEHGERLEAGARWWLWVVATLSFLAGALSILGILRPVTDALRGLLTGSLAVGSLQLSLGSLLAFGIVIWGTTMASRLLRMLLEADVLPHLDLPDGLPDTISRLTHYAMLTLGVIISLAAAGVELSQLAFMFGALGVGIGFGLQNIVSNFISGLILLFERPIKRGDWIEVGSLVGEVKSIGIRACHVRTLDGAEVIVPNANLISNNVVNWTLTDRLRRLAVSVRVAYGTNPTLVLEVLTRVAEEHPRVRKAPVPDVLFTGFGESSLDFQLRFWVTYGQGPQLHSDITLAVHDALYAAGIEIPFPQRDLHVRTVDGAAARTWHAPPEPKTSPAPQDPGSDDE